MTSIKEIQDGTLKDEANESQRCVEFSFYRKDAKQSWLVGEFTNWQTDRLAMDRREDGWWVLSVPLAPGDYRFRYLADESGSLEWFTDFASHGVEYAKGQWNSVVVVPEGSRTTAAPKQRERETPSPRKTKEMLAA